MGRRDLADRLFGWQKDAHEPQNKPKAGTRQDDNKNKYESRGKHEPPYKHPKHR
jgi:hypothetical protein